jgi:uncharacterized protein YneF (UPF0154 family)
MSTTLTVVAIIIILFLIASIIAGIWVVKIQRETNNNHPINH